MATRLLGGDHEGLEHEAPPREVDYCYYLGETGGGKEGQGQGQGEMGGLCRSGLGMNWLFGTYVWWRCLAGTTERSEVSMFWVIIPG